MILQLTPEELEEFANKVAQWHYDCVTFILTNWRGERSFIDQAPANQFRELRIKYEQQNPKPNWKSLL